MERWRTITDEAPLFEISSLGNIRHKKFKRVRKTRLRYGYPTITIGVPKKTYLIHRLVAKYFLENFDIKLDVDHINRVRHDNKLSNLRMTTRKENCANRIPSVGLVEHIIELHNQGFDIKTIYETINR